MSRCSIYRWRLNLPTLMRIINETSDKYDQLYGPKRIRILQEIFLFFTSNELIFKGYFVGRNALSSCVKNKQSNVRVWRIIYMWCRFFLLTRQRFVESTASECVWFCEVAYCQISSWKMILFEAIKRQNLNGMYSQGYILLWREGDFDAGTPKIWHFHRMLIHKIHMNKR